MYSNCPISSNVTFDCADPYPECVNARGFQFSDLHTILGFTASCPSDTRVRWKGGDAYLTYPACVAFSGGKMPTVYPPGDIWTRLTTWKAPLLQLVVQFPRPPLSLGIEVFVLIHLLGNPISTIRSLLLKLASCECRASFWKAHSSAYSGILHHVEVESGYERHDRVWKALANIVDSYDEWGRNVGDKVEMFIFDKLSSKTHADRRSDFLLICLEVSDVLAADRSTKSLPIAIALSVFIASVGIAFVRTEATSYGPNPTTYINIEAHSVAFAALYFWLIPAVILGSMIGTSQTESAVPRTLSRFKRMVEHLYDGEEQDLPGNDVIEDKNLRKMQGGIYSWHSRESRESITRAFRRERAHRADKPLGLGCNSESRPMRLLAVCTSLNPGVQQLLFSLAIFMASIVTAVLISFLVPPIGFGCRSVGEASMGVLWLAMPLVDSRFFKSFYNGFKRRATRKSGKPAGCGQDDPPLFVIAAVEGFTAVTVLLVVAAVQVGIFNSCYCFSLFGTTAVSLPQITGVSKVLSLELNVVFPLVAFLCIGFNLVVVPLIVWVQYPHAIRVFLQLDRGASNRPKLIHLPFLRSLRKRASGGETWGRNEAISFDA